MNPEALLFWNLWLDSEAERCYRKFKTYHWLMEAGVDVNCKNVAVFSSCLKIFYIHAYGHIYMHVFIDFVVVDNHVLIEFEGNWHCCS